MPYQVIARKWRPQVFEDVVGQQVITHTLRNAVREQRLHHAYIFAGPRGVGKTTTARIFARALNCLKGPTTTPCGECPACQEIARGSSIDVLEIDAATHTQVDNVRDVIISSVATAPARDPYKVFIIDEVHQLSNHAFNALLKTLEEPPPHVLFIMATTERHKVPDTILSRCQIFEFRLISESKIFDRLRWIAEQEQVNISDTALHKIARAGAGSMRDAQTVFDQVISFAGHDISDEDVIAALGIVGTELLIGFTEAIASGNSQRVLRLIHELIERGYDARSFCRELMGHFRNLLVLESVGYDSDLVALSGPELESIRQLQGRFSEGELIRAFHLLTEVDQNLRYATDPRFQLELGLVKLAQAERLKSVAELVVEVEALERRLLQDAPAASRKTPRPPSSRSPHPGDSTKRSSVPDREVSDPPHKYQSDSKGPPGEQAATGVAMAPIGQAETLVEQVKARLGDRGKMVLWSALDQARNVALTDDTLHVALPKEARLFRETLMERQNVKLIETIARDIAGRDIQFVVSTEKKKRPGKSRVDNERDRLRTEAEKDPIVRSLIETFKGELIKVVPKKGDGN